MQANEVIKYITRTGVLLAGKILIFDAQTLQSRIIKIGDITSTIIKGLKETANIPTVSVDELKAGLALNALELVDVRTETEHEDFNIGGTHVPLERIYTYF